MWLTWWWQPSWILPCWIQPLPSWIQTPCYLLWDSLLKNTLTPLWLWLKLQFNLINLMMASIMNSATLDSAILHKTLTQTNSIWLNIIHSHSTWWCQPSWILPSSNQPFWTKKIFTHSFSLNLRISAILNSAFYLVSHFEFKKKLHSFILTQTWWWQPSWILPSWISAILHKKTLLIHSHSTWWWQPFWILPCWIQKLPSLDSDTLLSSLRFTQKHSHSTLTLTQTNSIWLKLIHSHLNLMMVRHLVFLPSWIQGHFRFSHLCTSLIHSHSHLQRLVPSHLAQKELHCILPLVPAILTQTKTSLIHSDSTWWWQPSWILPTLDSDTLLSPLRLTQKHSHSILILTQPNSIWWICWWQPSWIVPSF